MKAITQRLPFHKETKNKVCYLTTKPDALVDRIYIPKYHFEDSGGYPTFIWVTVEQVEPTNA